MDYTIHDHRHRFAVWATARAAQRGLEGGTIGSLADALELSGLPSMVSGDRSEWPKTARDVDGLHRVWCRAIVDHLGSLEVEASYGRAAKLVAIYIKTTVVLGPGCETPFGLLAHPPVDELLLDGLCRAEISSEEHHALWRTAEWTKLDEKGYFALIKSFRKAGLDKPAFWMIERYWKPGLPKG